MKQLCISWKIKEAVEKKEFERASKIRYVVHNE